MEANKYLKKFEGREMTKTIKKEIESLFNNSVDFTDYHAALAEDFPHNGLQQDIITTFRIGEVFFNSIDVETMVIEKIVLYRSAGKFLK